MLNKGFNRAATVVLLLGASACSNTQRWTLSFNLGTNIKTECKSNSCTSYTCTDLSFKDCTPKANCKLSELITRNYGMMGMNASIQVCPDFVARNRDPNDTPLSSSYAFKAKTDSSIETLGIDSNNIESLDIKASSGENVSCVIDGKEAAANQLILSRKNEETANDHYDITASLKYPAAKVSCTIPKRLLDTAEDGF